MKLISHRGNLTGKDPNTENSPDKIDFCIFKGFDVEIDLWVIKDKIYLGHDYPQYEIDKKYLDERQDSIWIHCKNETCLFYFNRSNYNYFWHETDKFTITSKRFIWTYPEQKDKFYKNQIILDFDVINKEKLHYYKSKEIFGL